MKRGTIDAGSTFTVKCGKPNKTKTLIARAAEGIRDKMRFVHQQVELRLARGPYISGGEVCFDYTYNRDQD